MTPRWRTAEKNRAFRSARAVATPSSHTEPGLGTDALMGAKSYRMNVSADDPWRIET
jgi:hypothetical protein